jgi:hypothetical protein
MADIPYRLLISVVGDFPSEILPVYHHFSRQVELHLMLHDDARRDRRQAQRIFGGIERRETRTPTAIRSLPQSVDEHDPDGAAVLIERIGRLAGNDYTRVLFNATGASGALYFELACRLRSLGASVLSYDRFENRCEVLSPHGIERFACQGCDIPTHLELMGYEMLAESRGPDLESRRKTVMELGGRLDRYKEFSDAYGRLKSAEAIHGYRDIKERLQAIGRLDVQHYIQGTLFEEYIFFLLRESGWFDDIRTGVKVRFDDEVENEFDILMIRENHLHTIECKLVNKLDGEHYVYKTDKVLRYLDYDGRGMILSVGADNVRRKSRGRIERQFTRGDLARARHAEILVYQQRHFDPAEFMEAVKEWFIDAYEETKPKS